MCCTEHWLCLESSEENSSQRVSSQYKYHTVLFACVLLAIVYVNTVDHIMLIA